MSSITLNRIIDQCAHGLLISYGKKKTADDDAAHRVFNAAWDAYEHKKGISPLGPGFIIRREVKDSIITNKNELERILPICKRIAMLAERERARKDLDRCSQIAIGLTGVALLIPLDEEQSGLTSKPGIFAIAELIGVCAIQAIKHRLFPNRDAEKTELGRLWLELDGKIPLNTYEASKEMHSQMLFACAMVNFASVQLRVQV